MCEQLGPSAVSNGKRMSLLFIGVFIYCEEMEKWPAFQVHKQSWERIESRHVAIYPVGVPSGERDGVFTVIVGKKEHTWFLQSCTVRVSSGNCFLSISLFPGLPPIFETPPPFFLLY